ncbi:uncharacterized protein LOC135816497 [Sycon ciliatum]|uniref:uncharacterized protein LOC135816497 n=1 Tax=Sycon ciliatum TaxID=27933 RepID=UPI0031F65B8A
MDDVVDELSSQDRRFGNLKKKGASDRLHLLMSKQKSKDSKSKSAYGIVEDFSEADVLLTELQELKAEKEQAAVAVVTAKHAEKAVAEQMRADACRTLSEKSSAEDRPQKTKRSSTYDQADPIITYLEKKNDALLKIEERKVYLEEEKFAASHGANAVALEERRLALQEREMALKEEAQRDELASKKKKEQEESKKAEDDRQDRKQKAEQDREERSMFLQLMAATVKKMQ